MKIKKPLVKSVGLVLALGRMAKYILLSVKHGRQLSIRQDNLKNISKQDIILFCTLRNESNRIPFFLDFYRKKGIRHFVFVDNGSTEGFAELVRSVKDVSVFYTNASFKNSNFGMHWLNFLLRRYGSGHWCLTCDPDEFLVYPRHDALDLKDLTTYLESNHRRAFFTQMVDMYGKGPLKDAHYEPGQDPLSACPYFDAHGYFYTSMDEQNSVWAQGGVRMRTLFKTNPYCAPAINKIPLIRWRWFYFYPTNMHMAVPRRLNGCYRDGLTGALLHFKFIASFQQKIEEEMSRRQHYNESAEYERYIGYLTCKPNYHSDHSVKYRGWRQLAKLGLIKNKEWN